MDGMEEYIYLRTKYLSNIKRIVYRGRIINIFWVVFSIIGVLFAFIYSFIIK